MPSSDKERDFTAFDEGNYPGMMVPEMFNDVEDAGDGNPGLQRAIKNWAYWYLHSGNIGSGIHMAGYDITGINNLYGNNIDILTLAQFSGNIEHTGGDFTGHLNHISGYESVSANTGIFQDIKGFSDINIKDSLDFGSTYHLKGVDQISGINVVITNANITNVVNDLDFGSSYDIKNAAEITGAKGYFTTSLTGAQGKFTGIDMGGGNIVNPGTVDTIDVSGHIHDTTAGNGSYIPGQLVAWKTDLDTFHNTSLTTYVDTDASITITLPCACTVEIIYSFDTFMTTVVDKIGKLIINDGSDISATEVHAVQNSNYLYQTEIPGGGHYIANYAAGSTTWKIRIKTVTDGGVQVTNLRLTVKAYAQLASS